MEGGDIVMVRNSLLNNPNCCLNCAGRLHLCRLVEEGLGFDAAGDLQEVAREEQTGAGTSKPHNIRGEACIQALAVLG